MRSIWLLLITAWICTTPVMAEDPTYESEYDWPVLHLGGRVGYIELSNVDDEGSFNYGVNGGVFFRSWLALELSIDLQDTVILEIALGDPDLYIDIERGTTALQAGLILMPFPEHPVRPYATAGLGYYYSRYTSEYYPPETLSEQGYYAGIGLEGSYSGWDDTISFTLEARWLFTEKSKYAEREIQADGFSAMLGVRAKFP